MQITVAVDARTGSVRLTLGDQIVVVDKEGAEDILARVQTALNQLWLIADAHAHPPTPEGPRRS